jgi:competence protein ComEA
MPSFTRYQTIAALLIAAIIVGAAVYFARSGAVGAPTAPVELSGPEGSLEVLEPASEPEKPLTLCVHVAGRVAKPGVYELAPGSRVKDAIAAAGGASENAELDTLNLAQKLQDGQQVYVALKGQVPAPAASLVRGGDAASSGKPSKMEAKAGNPGIAKYSEPGDGTVSINKGSAEELQHLPGVGPAMAQRIIEYRTANGGFKSVEELEEVRGIGAKTLAKMKPFVKL